MGAEDLSSAQITRGILAPAGSAVAILAALVAGSGAEAAPIEEILHSFGSPADDGAEPSIYSGLVRDAAGNLFGTTLVGGANGKGTVFEITPGPSGGEKVIWNFGSTGDGARPAAALTLLPSGAFVGTTAEGGANGSGAVFQLKPPLIAGGPWREKLLYSFRGPAASDGAMPGSSLFSRSSGVLIGTTTAGGTGTNCGSSGCGTVFSLTPPAVAGGPWTETVLYSFAGGTADGYFPVSSIIHTHGAFYGITAWGGSGTACGTGGCGTVFQLIPGTSGAAWQEFVIHDFAGAPGDGFNPQAGLVVDESGNLYGTTEAGGSGSCPAGCGTVYELTPNGANFIETILMDFPDATWGQYLVSPLTFDSSGALYGSTYFGGINGAGTIYVLDPVDRWGFRAFEVIYDFAGGTADGSGPSGQLVITGSGAIIGMTQGGGANSDGTAFKLRP